MHIGLIPQQAGFDIFEQNFGNVLAGPKTQGRAHPHRGPRARRLRHAAARRAARDLAGQRRTATTTIRPTGRRQALDDRVSRLGPRLLRLRDRPLPLRDHQAGRGEAATAGAMAPHVNFWIVARGINIGLNTRMYFADEAEANAKDPVLNLIEWEVRRRR